MPGKQTIKRLKKQYSFSSTKVDTQVWKEEVVERDDAFKLLEDFVNMYLREVKSIENSYQEIMASIQERFKELVTQCTSKIKQMIGTEDDNEE